MSFITEQHIGLFTKKHYFCSMIEWKDTMMGALGIAITCESKGSVVATMPVNNNTCQRYGILHGGASLALAETVAGFGSEKLCDENEIPCGLSVSANHIAAVQIGQTVTATGKLLFKGKSTHIWNVDITDESGKLISTVRIVNHIIRKDKE